MVKISVKTIEDAIYHLCAPTNCILSADVYTAIQSARERESSCLGRSILDKLIQNADLASRDNIPLCQDTGMVVLFIEIGQEVHLVDGLLEGAVQNGVRRGYKDHYLRKSVVSDPLRRNNTGDNTPAIIHYDIVPGDEVKISFASKGFGSENMSRLKMLIPADGVEGVKNFVLETVSDAGSNPCPPIIVGVGIGGTVEKAALLSKKALFRPIDDIHPDEYYRDLEKELLEKINQLGIGPQGLGGNVTALAVKILSFPTHIAGLPVCVNINCHASRHREITIKGEV